MNRAGRPGRALVACVLAACVEYGDPLVPPAPEGEAPASEPSFQLEPLVPVLAPSSAANGTNATALPGMPPGTTGNAPAAAPSAGATSAAAAAAVSASAEPPPAPRPWGTPPPDLPLLGSAARPELDPAVAGALTVRDYLALAGDLTAGLRRDDWDPTGGGGEVLGFTADYRVAPSGGTHTSVQAAISAAVAEGGSERRFIELAPGSYREVVCVPAGAPPITLYGLDPDATRTSIAFDNYAGKPKAAGAPANPCNPNTGATSFGTSGSATFAVFAQDFVAENLTLANDTDEAAASGNLQAPALLSLGDRALYENVRVLGNQDTLLVKSSDVNTVSRAYFKGCYIEGDSDFILGRGTLVLDGCTIHSLSSRRSGGVLAPSTDARQLLGFLVTRSSFTADSGAAEGSIALGRAWDENQADLGAYAQLLSAGVYPNGQVLVRESELGAHIERAAPWDSARSSARPYASDAGEYPANRLYEYANSGPGSSGAAAE